MVFLPLRPLGPSRLSQGCDCWSNRILVQDEAGLFFSPWTLCQLLLYPVCLCLVGMFRYLRTMSHFGGEGLPLHDSWKWQRMRGRVVVCSTFENVDSPWPFFSCANKEGEGWLMPVHLQGTSGRNQKSFRKHPMYKSIRLCHTQNYGHFYFGIALCWTYWTHRKLSTYSSRATLSSFQILSWDCALSQILCVCNAIQPDYICTSSIQRQKFVRKVGSGLAWIWASRADLELLTRKRCIVKVNSSK